MSKSTLKDKITDVSQTLWDSVNHRASSLKNKNQDHGTDHTLKFNIDGALYDEVERIAMERETSVSNIVNNAISYYLDMQLHIPEPKIRLEDKESNPLLILDGIVGKSTEKSRMTRREALKQGVTIE